MLLLAFTSLIGLSSAPQQDSFRLESLVYDGKAATWRAVEVSRSTLRLRAGWNLYPELPSEAGLEPWLVAARTMDRVLGRAVALTTKNLGSFFTGTPADPNGRVRDVGAAEEFFRLAVHGKPVERRDLGERLLVAARLLVAGTRLRASESGDPRIHERLSRSILRVDAVAPRSWSVRAQPRGSGFDVSGVFYRDRRCLELVEVRAHVSRDARIDLQERALIAGPVLRPVVDSDDSVTRLRAAERAADLALVRRRFEAALDPRRTILRARRLCTGDEPPTRAAIVAALGPPDHRTGRGADEAAVYGLWNGTVVEFVGRPRIHELRVARPPRPRTPENDELVSGPTIDRLWVSLR